MSNKPRTNGEPLTEEQMKAFIKITAGDVKTAIAKGLKQVQEYFNADSV